MLTSDFTYCLNSPCLSANKTWGYDIGAYGEGCGEVGADARQLFHRDR